MPGGDIIVITTIVEQLLSIFVQIMSKSINIPMDSKYGNLRNVRQEQIIIIRGQR